MAIVPVGAAAPTPVPVLDDLSINDPGDTSQVISPIPVTAEMNVAESGSIRLELVDESGWIISRKIYAFHACAANSSGGAEDALVLHEPIAFCGGRQVKITTDLAFAMDVEHQAGRLQVSIQDDVQRILTLNSVSLTLLESGTAKIVSPPPGEQGIRITDPENGASISGKVLVIAGEAPPTHILPMRIEVVTAQGKALGSRMMSVGHSVSQSGEVQKGVFRIEIPYKIKDAQSARITITAADENILGDRYIASRVVTLLP